MTDEEQLAKALWESIGPWSIPVLLVVFGVRMFRMPGVQVLLPSRWRWDNMNAFVRTGLIFAASVGMSCATAIIAGESWKTAFLAAIPVALASIATHKATKAAGHKMHKDKLIKDPFYEPSKFRKAASIIVPLKKAFLRKE